MQVGQGRMHRLTESEALAVVSSTSFAQFVVTVTLYKIKVH